MKMVQGALLTCLLTGTLFPAWAEQDSGEKFRLDHVKFQLTSKAWVSTTTAKVSVSVNATLNDTSLVEARNNIMSNLDKIAQGKWHITAFNRSQDSSGLERLYVTAEARVPEQSLTKINTLAKSVSQPGARYRIQNIDFTPQLSEVEKVKARVRETIYSQANDEITRLNKQYPKQKYSLHGVVFLGPNVAMMLPRAKTKRMNTMVMAAQAAPSIAVSNEVKLTALIDVASDRNIDD